MSDISIVVPVYKVEKYLNRCVDSILAQSYTEFKLILVDDGSPDNCGKMCDDYAKQDSRIHVIHRKNGGLSAARNSGIDWVFNEHFTEWITFIDSDDWVHPDYLIRLLECNKNNQTNISIGGFVKSYDETAFSEITTDSRKVPPEDFWVENQGNATVAWGKLYKTELFKTVRYPEGKLHEDELTTYKLLFTQERISVTSDELYMYYQASTSIMRSAWNPKRLASLEGYGNQMIFFKDNGFERAFRESKKLFVFSVKNHLYQIKKSDDKNYRLFRRYVSNYLYSRYHSIIMSSSLFSMVYVRKLIVEQFFSIRFNVLKKTCKENGIKDCFRKIFRFTIK